MDFFLDTAAPPARCRNEEGACRVHADIYVSAVSAAEFARRLERRKFKRGENE